MLLALARHLIVLNACAATCAKFRKLHGDLRCTQCRWHVLQLPLLLLCRQERSCRPTPPDAQRVRSSSNERMVFNASWNQLTGNVPYWLVNAATHEVVDVSVSRDWHFC